MATGQVVGDEPRKLTPEEEEALRQHRANAAGLPPVSSGLDSALNAPMYSPLRLQPQAAPMPLMPGAPASSPVAAPAPVLPVAPAPAAPVAGVPSALPGVLPVASPVLPAPAVARPATPPGNINLLTTAQPAGVTGLISNDWTPTPNTPGHEQRDTLTLGPGGQIDRQRVEAYPNATWGGGKTVTNNTLTPGRLQPVAPQQATGLFGEAARVPLPAGMERRGVDLGQGQFVMATNPAAPVVTGMASANPPTMADVLARQTANAEQQEKDAAALVARKAERSPDWWANKQAMGLAGVGRPDLIKRADRLSSAESEQENRMAAGKQQIEGRVSEIEATGRGQLAVEAERGKSSVALEVEKGKQIIATQGSPELKQTYAMALEGAKNKNELDKIAATTKGILETQGTPFLRQAFSMQLHQLDLDVAKAQAQGKSAAELEKIYMEHSIRMAEVMARAASGGDHGKVLKDKGGTDYYWDPKTREMIKAGEPPAESSAAAEPATLPGLNLGNININPPGGTGLASAGGTQSAGMGTEEDLPTLTPEEARRLPPGTRFRTHDGRTLTRP